MFCSRCGKELPEGAKFCTNCGAQLQADGSSPAGNGSVNSSPDQNSRPDQNSGVKGNGTPSKKSAGIVIGVVAAVLAVVLLGGVVYATVGLNSQKKKLETVIKKAGIEEYQDRMDQAAAKWGSLGITDVSDKKEILNDLKDIRDDVETFQNCAEEVKKLEKEKETYHLEDSTYSAYEEILEECGKAVKNKEAEEAVALFEEAEDMLDELIETNDEYIDEMVETYEAADLSEAETEEAAVFEEHLEKINQLAEAEQKDYQSIRKALEEMNEVAYLYIDPENPLEISVQQVDATEFPKVKLYLNVKDPATGTVPEDLKNGMFYIRKEDANADYVKQEISTVNQLNELEALNVDMVADVSGSMNGSPLAEAKRIMCNFVNSVQFSAGDMVELTSFATGVRLEQEFCADAALLNSRINNLYTGDMTSLYDALYTSVERVASRTGARCVIAFTDGYDNYSSCTREAVISTAQRYHVPIFIIGIGTSDYSDVNAIAQQTGGAYFNAYDVYSMDSIYEEIYRMEKEMYLIEFEDNTGSKVTDLAKIRTGYRSMEYGGECQYSYTPNILLSVNGASIYRDGPEEVVERYLKGFDDAMTMSDFSYISDCLKPGSPIYEEQKAYVQRDIQEQLDSFEIVSVDYSDNNHCVVMTRETYFVQVGDKPLQLMTQECKYAVENDGNGWKLTSFAGEIHVTSRIKQ